MSDLNKSDRNSDGQSSTSKWRYVPGKVYNLPPLNLQDIKKQLLNESSEESDTETDCGEQEEVKEADISEVLNESFCVENALAQPPKDEFTNNIVNFNTYRNITQHGKNRLSKSLSPKLNSIPENYSDSSENTFSVWNTLEQENKENISNNDPAPHNTHSDSFDIDFSLLTLTTPAKNLDKPRNFMTPKINIIPATETKSTVSRASLLGSACLSSRQCGTLNQPLFKTPISKSMQSNMYSKPQQTPFMQSKIGRYNNSDVLDSQVKVSPVRYSGPDGYDRIVVKQVEYVVISKLGKGGSSEVFCCFCTEKRSLVAIKVVSLSDSNSTEGYVNEVKLLKSLQNCDRIITMFDYEIRDEQLVVVLEKGGDDLSAILKQLSTKQNHLPNHMLLFYWMEMLYSVQQIHENGVIHSDLKPANFLRMEQGLKLIDFGIASRVQEDMTCVYKVNQEGSCNYISPEALIQQKSGNFNSPTPQTAKYKVHFKSDVWSLGCILYQLVYRKTPFQHISQIWSKLTAITDPNHKICFPKADWVSPRIIATIKNCLQYDVKLRPSVNDLICEYEQLLQKI